MSNLTEHWHSPSSSSYGWPHNRPHHQPSSMDLKSDRSSYSVKLDRSSPPPPHIGPIDPPRYIHPQRPQPLVPSPSSLLERPFPSLPSPYHYNSNPPYSHIKHEVSTELPSMNYISGHSHVSYTRGMTYPPETRYDSPPRIHRSMSNSDTELSVEHSPRFHSSSRSSQPPNLSPTTSHRSPTDHRQTPDPAEPKSPRSIQSSKRAAQNRAAQRAFRQRKDRYIKDLESRAAALSETKAELVNVKAERDGLLETVRTLREEIERAKGQSHSQSHSQSQSQPPLPSLVLQSPPPSSSAFSSPSIPPISSSYNYNSEDNPRHLILQPTALKNFTSPLPSPPTSGSSPPPIPPKTSQWRPDPERVMDNLCELLVTRSSRPDLQGRAGGDSARISCAGN